MPARQNTRKIALTWSLSVPWLARVVEGIRQFLRENDRNWSLFSSPPINPGSAEAALTIHSLQGWRGDGIILASNDKRELQAAHAMEIPAINLGGGVADSRDVPRVIVNHHLAGQMAAEHLLGLGLRNFAFFGWEGMWYSDQRRLGFGSRIAQSGLTIESFLQSPQAAMRLNWTEGIARVTAWLESLPKPVGIFAVHDYRAQLLVEACQAVRLRIPDDIAIIGMDNDEVVCEHTIPTLTSICRNSGQIGWNAAALLDRLMDERSGPPRDVEDIILAPDGVIVRQSTDKLYCADPIVQRTVDYMRANLTGQFNVLHLAEHMAISKRTLEMRFSKETGTSPYNFLNRLRVQHAQTLLLQPKKRTVELIAAECGFGTIPTFYAAFQRVTGTSLPEFRKNLALKKMSRNGPFTRT